MTWNLQNMAPPKKTPCFPSFERDPLGSTAPLPQARPPTSWWNERPHVGKSSLNYLRFILQKKNGGNKLTNIENLYNLSILISNTLTYHSSTVIKCISTSSTLSASRPRYRLNHRSMLRWPRGQVIAYSCYILYYNIRIYIYTII